MTQLRQYTDFARGAEKTRKSSVGIARVQGKIRNGCLLGSHLDRHRFGQLVR
jgi:hypothetical protein